jgi:hypothetical protein
MCSAQLASRSPPRFSRWRWVLPEDAGSGATAHRCANELSERSRSGLSPTVISSYAADWMPMLVISRRTAEQHVHNVYRKIDVSTRAAAALVAMEHDLLEKDA